MTGTILIKCVDIRNVELISGPGQETVSHDSLSKVSLN